MTSNFSIALLILLLYFQFAHARIRTGYLKYENNPNTQLDAAEITSRHENKWRLLLIILAPIVTAIILVGFALYCTRRKWIKSTGTKYLKNNDQNLLGFSLATVEKATGRFSDENKLGEGGYGPVYKGVLPSGQEIAVKKLSRTSKQGFVEFKNEVTLTAQLQHVNLVRLLGFCVDGEEHMLVYEYMPTKASTITFLVYIFSLSSVKLDLNRDLYDPDATRS